MDPYSDPTGQNALATKIVQDRVAASDDPLNIYRKSGKLKAAKAIKLQNAADYRRLTEDPLSLGLTDAQKAKMKAEAVQTAGAQNQGLSTNLAQQALAGGSLQQGAFTEAQRDIADSTSDAAVKASQGINELSQRMIEGEKNRIMGNVDAARERTREDARFWSQFGIDSASKVVGGVTGALGAGLLGGATAPATAEGIDAAAGGYGAAV